MLQHSIKSIKTITQEEIQIVGKHLGLAKLSVSDFGNMFSNSDFHILTDNGHLVSFARINHDFNLKIGNNHYSFAEFVGFVSIVKGKGYGSQLLKEIVENLRGKNIECIGFCEKPLRPFYQKNFIESLYDKAPFIKESVDGEWLSATDDDILCINLSEKNKELLWELNNENPAFFFDKTVLLRKLIHI